MNSQAFKIVQARVAQESNAFSGVLSMYEYDDDLSSIKSIRIGGHIFKRCSTRRLESYYAKVLPNGLIVVLEITDAFSDKYAAILRVCEKLAKNGVVFKGATNHLIDVSYKSIEVRLKSTSEDDDGDEVGIDTHKADDEVKEGMQKLIKLDAFIGTLPKSIELLGSTLKRQSNYDDCTFAYALQDKIYLMFALEGEGNDTTAKHRVYLATSIEIQNGLSGNDVVTFNQNLKDISVDKLTDFNQVLLMCQDWLKSNKVTSFADSVFTYEFSGKSNHSRVPIQNRNVFEKELNDLVSKHRLIVDQKAKK